MMSALKMSRSVVTYGCYEIKQYKNSFLFHILHQGVPEGNRLPRRVSPSGSEQAAAPHGPSFESLVMSPTACQALHLQKSPTAAAMPRAV